MILNVPAVAVSQVCCSALASSQLRRWIIVKAARGKGGGDSTLPVASHWCSGAAVPVCCFCSIKKNWLYCNLSGLAGADQWAAGAGDRDGELPQGSGGRIRRHEGAV